jgi:hypothetical protein
MAMLKVTTLFQLRYFVDRCLLAFSFLCIAILLPSRILSRVLLEGVNALDGIPKMY